MIGEIYPIVKEIVKESSQFFLVVFLNKFYGQVHVIHKNIVGKAMKNPEND